MLCTVSVAMGAWDRRGLNVHGRSFQTKVPGWNALMSRVRNITDISLSETALECDLVYRWVNPLHVNSIESALIGDTQRLRDNDELRFSMRSFMNIAGILAVHVVAKGGPPSWLDTTHKRIFWWNETHMLDGLRREFQLELPLCVFNSEPAKLAVAQIPNLAARFLLLDDDMFMVPPLHAHDGLSTRIFFNEQGLPLHTHLVYQSHQPHPFITAEYQRMARGEHPLVVQRLLYSCKERKVFNKTMVDRLVAWTSRMWTHGTAVPVRFPPSTFNAFRQGLTTGHSRFETSLFSKRLWEPSVYENPAEVQPESPALIHFVAEKFFGEVRQRRPYLICVNDEWPEEPVAYNVSVQPFHRFLREMYPAPAPWEIAHAPSAKSTTTVACAGSGRSDSVRAAPGAPRPSGHQQSSGT